MPYDWNELPTNIFYKTTSGSFLPIVDTRCCGCGELIDVAKDIELLGDSYRIGASRHERDSRNGYDLFHSDCPNTDIQNKQLATREDYFTKKLGLYEP